MSNREELTRQAEKSLRQGRVEDAIALYQELADLTPIDWGIVKQLADLFERAGQHEAASRQFCRWADHLFVEGFHSKAAALYKKVLKLDAGHEHALWQLGEVSLELKLRADARVAFQRVLDLRQRRGDQAGASAARERLATMEAAAPAPVRSTFSGLTPIAPPADAIAPAPVSAPPMDAPAGPLASTGVAAPALAAASPIDIARAPVVAAEPPVPPETPEMRLARLRGEAEDAGRRHAPDAEARWQAVLEADPQDVATRLRLVRLAMDRGDVESADRLAMPLDASDTPALVLLVELAWQRGRPDAVRRLLAGRVHAGASPGHVLAPLDALGGRLPGAARMALAAAVTAWNAAGQPGHAVAALELADRRGLLDTELYLQWVEICVDAGVSGLSRAQEALARAYVAEGRVVEARAVAEDLVVREAGAEPYRALLLDILDRLGEPNPHRVLVDLLTPPSEVVEEVAPLELAPTVDEVVDLDLDLDAIVAFATGDAGDTDRPAGAATAPPWGAVSDLSLAEPVTLAPAAAGAFAPQLSLPDVAPSSALAAPSTLHVEGVDTSASVVAASEPLAAVAAAPTTAFDWAFLLGRDVEDGWSAAPAAVTTNEPWAPERPEAEALAPAIASPAPSEATVSPAEPQSVSQAPGDVADAMADHATGADAHVVDVAALVEETEAGDSILSDAGASMSPPTGDVEAEAGVPLLEESSDAAEVGTPEPMAVAEDSGTPEDAPSAVHAPVDPLLARIAAAQPVMAEPAEVLPPTFSVPTSWFADQPSAVTSVPRQRRPEDAYLFEEDDQIPSRWAPRPAVVRPPSSPAGLVRPVATESPVVEPEPQHECQPELAAVVPPAYPDPGAVVMSGDDDLVDQPDGHDSEVAEPVPDLVEEEIDLTQLLEELKQFDTVLPDPPARTSVADGLSVSPATDVPVADAPAVPAPTLSLEDLLTPPPADAAPPVLPVVSMHTGDDGSTELEAVFADLHRHTDERLVAEQQLAAGRVFLAAGLVAEAARAFERASQAPRSRFAAAQALAELHRSRGQLVDAVVWYEQAAAAPVPDAAVKRPVLYDLAESLEALGESDRALGVLLDLLSQVEDYRDARARLDRLLRVDAGG